MTHRIGLRAIAVLLAAAIFSTSGLAADNTVRVGLVAGGYAPYAPVDAAQKLGYYKANGLDVEINYYRGGAAGQEALVAGAVDILSFFPPGVAIAIKKGVKQKIVASDGLRTPHGWHLIVKADSPIRSPKDLAGKKIGVTAKGSTTDFYALWAAKSGGVKAQTVPVGGRTLVPALKQGQIDAAVLWPTLTYSLVASGKFRSVVDYGAAMKPNLPGVWVATQVFIDKKPKLVRGFLQAVSKATRKMQTDEAYGRSQLKRFSKIKDDKVLDLAYKAIVKNSDTDGMIKVEWLKESLGLAALAGQTDMPPLSAIWTDKFVPVTAK